MSHTTIKLIKTFYLFVAIVTLVNHVKYPITSQSCSDNFWCLMALFLLYMAVSTGNNKQ